jgi:hypothetical protein
MHGSLWCCHARSPLALRICQRCPEPAWSRRLRQAKREQLVSRGNEHVTALGSASSRLSRSDRGQPEQMQNTYADYEKNITYLASLHCETIGIEGAPRLMAWTVNPR